ncbi:MAG: methyltransferase domain-containing protein [Deltaproteobacteria bacterium]|nr:methyltransferase domain-containing protein [Deltaproteobacteria bacterium]
MHDEVKNYYGKILSPTNDLKTNACCTAAAYPDYVRSALSNVHDEVLSRYYGCGLVAPQDLAGMSILDLGSGSGRDCYVLAQLVGETGRIVGVDMTDEQLEVAQRHLTFHCRKFGYETGNVEFKKGYIERLDELELADETFDIIVSNCVINLSPDKPAVLNQAYRLLKPGGELYFSDVYADRRVPKHLMDDPALYGECLSGALYWNDFIRLSQAAGFTDPRLVEDRCISLDNEEIEKKIGHIRFFSATYRLFKIAGLESACEDFGQAVIYKGTVAHHPKRFILDKHHIIETGKVFPVCGNTYRMLNESRFKRHFDFIGSWDTHYGLFGACGGETPFGETTPESDAGGTCC